MKHLITLQDWDAAAIQELLKLGQEIKADPDAYREAMRYKTLLMIFEKPSLRTRISFETGMTQMGGHAVYYDTGTSPLGAGKESVADTVRTVCRYVNLIIARLFDHAMIEEMAAYAGHVPVVNALTDYAHPCQILADLLTMQEKKGRLKGLKIAYLGDSNNNVTHSLMIGCALMGIDMSVACPARQEFMPAPEILNWSERAAAENGATVTVTDEAAAAVTDADVVYTDSWMSYHIPPHKMEERVNAFRPYQVNSELMEKAAGDAIFMNCLPAARGYEQTAEVIDGPQSVVFDQAENRLHIQKAVLLTLLRQAED